MEHQNIINSNDFENIELIEKNISIETISSNIFPRIVKHLSIAIIHLKLSNQDTKFYSIVTTGSDKFARKSIIKFFEMYKINIIYS